MKSKKIDYLKADYLRDINVKKSILMMYELAGNKKLKYYRAIQRIIDYIVDLELEIDKLHTIHDEYGHEYIENTHLIDSDYQNRYLRRNKYLIELNNGQFVDVNDLKSKYEDYKTRCENLKKCIEKYVVCMKDSNLLIELNVNELLNILNGDK